RYGSARPGAGRCWRRDGRCQWVRGLSPPSASAFAAPVGGGGNTVAAELLVGLHRPVQGVGQTVLSLAVAGPVPLGHRGVRILHGGVHVLERRIELLLGGAGLTGGSTGAVRVAGRGVPATVHIALTGLGVGGAGGSGLVIDRRVTRRSTGVTAEDEVERFVERRREAD